MSLFKANELCWDIDTCAGFPRYFWFTEVDKSVCSDGCGFYMGVEVNPWLNSPIHGCASHMDEETYIPNMCKIYETWIFFGFILMILLAML